MLEYYLNPEIPVFREGQITSNTIICPLAFGRNTWDDAEVLKRFLGFRMRSVAPLTDFEMFRLLRNRNFDPGIVNQELAETCFRWASHKQEGNMAPYMVYGQWEVMYALHQAHTEWYEKFCLNGAFLRAIWPEATYLSTRDVLDQINSVGRQIAIVAQEFHLARCLRLADAMFGRSRVIAGIPGSDQYDPSSVQPHTRNRENFLAQEKKARIFDAAPASLRWVVRKLIDK